jgi:hypothetical protein
LNERATTTTVIARLDRAIQYSREHRLNREAAVYWIPGFRGLLNLPVEWDAA